MAAIEVLLDERILELRDILVQFPLAIVRVHGDGWEKRSGGEED